MCHMTANAAHAGRGVSEGKNGIAGIGVAAATWGQVAGMELTAPIGQWCGPRAITFADIVVGTISHCVGFGDFIRY